MKCYHCGELCDKKPILIEEKPFCCKGCKTVYELLVDNNLNNFYELNSQAGISPDEKSERFDFLDTLEVYEQLIDFEDDKLTVIDFHIPVIHCSSCIWLLESVHKMKKGIIRCSVNFTKKNVRVTYQKDAMKLSEVAIFLSSLGYKPSVSLASLNNEEEKVDRSLIYKIGVTGFCFGNIMLFAFPEYLEETDVWLEHYKELFRWLAFVFSLPVFFYGASGYLKSAFKGLQQKALNIDVPISLGILVLFIRSCFEIFTGIGSGYFDSLGGLIFFLLLGKYFQQRTYKSMAFDRDYKSYYPIAVTKITENLEENILLSKLKVGDRILIRNQEIIPADGVLIKGNARIDNSFVTGESRLNKKTSGDKIYAGGKQVGDAIEIEIVKEVDQSYLTQLWKQDAFKDKAESYEGITNEISKYFTVVILVISLLTSIYWFYTDYSRIFEIVSAVLIVACPCALAISAPFTLGNMLRLFASKSFYIKDALSIERLARINHIVFDKTGTITVNDASETNFIGADLGQEDLRIIKSIARNSNHPLSRSLYEYIPLEILKLETFKEEVGNGLYASYKGKEIRIGSAKWLGIKSSQEIKYSQVHIEINQKYMGCFVFKNRYRKDLAPLLKELSNYDLTILSGDNDSEKTTLEAIMPDAELKFFQKPDDKLNYIKEIESQKNILMIGDGLNDAGALKQSSVGITITDNVNSFSPACDAILDAKRFKDIARFIKLSKKAIWIVKWSFAISFSYNIVGISFAVTGYLSPLVAAILMPVSSISVVVFATLMTNLVFKRSKVK